MSDERDRWRRVRRLFEDAVELEGEERRRFLEDECGGDESLRAEVEALIEHESGAPSQFIEPPAVAPTATPSGGSPDAGAGAEIVGRTLGDFELLEEIGRGGMGTVFRARQAGLDRDAAVKVVGPQSLTDATSLERFRREARHAAQLDHPNIARVLAEGVTDGVAWFAMELVGGPSLSQEIRWQGTEYPSGQPRSLPALTDPGYARAVAELISDVADALAHAHAHGVVHRDVKPSNILFAHSGEVKLVDFGVARDSSLGTITRSDQIVGSLPYMSPEQARVVRSRVDERTDIYSAGVVLYELLSLHRPFEGGTTHEVLSKIRFSEPRPLRRWNERVPADLAVICEKAMAKSARERYSSAAELRDDLLRFARGEAIVARPPTPVMRLRRWLVRRRTAVAVALTLTLAVFVTWRVQRYLAPPPPMAALSVVGAQDPWITVRPLDEWSGQPLAASPERDGGFAPGCARVVVKSTPDAPPLEFCRELRRGETVIVDITRPRWERAGSTDGMVRIERGVLKVERPSMSQLVGREVDVDPFWLDEAEVSVGEYREFLQAVPSAPRPAAWGRIDAEQLPGDRPMTWVTWEEARAYAEWRGKRLPTLAEWMWAARGQELRELPWDPALGWIGATNGKRPEEVTYGAQLECFLTESAPVRSMPEAMVEGRIYHMLGNVAEWTATPFMDTQSTPPRLQPGQRKICGGAWITAYLQQQLPDTTAHGMTGPGGAHFMVGFRCALTAD